MNQLDRNKRIHQLRSMYETHNVSSKVVELLKPFITGIIRDEIRYNEYLTFDKTVQHRYNSGRVSYYNNSYDIEIKGQYQPLYTYVNKVASINWYCTLNRDTTITVTIKIYNGHIHGHHHFSETFELEELFYEKKKWFKMRTFVNTDIIANKMVNYDESIKEAIGKAIKGMINDLEKVMK